MNRKQAEQVSEIWNLYERHKSFNHYEKMYEESKENYDNYFGRQWEGLERPKSSQEPMTLNIIKPIMKFKMSILNQKDYEIVINPNSYATYEELKVLQIVSRGFSQFINRMWEKSQTSKKVRRIVKDSAIDAEGILSFVVDETKNNFINSEIIDKNNICYGNENEEDIQKQPYILTVRRLPVDEVKELARKYKAENKNNLTDEDIENIVSDVDYYEMPGAIHRVNEITPMCLVIRKYYKKDGKIFVSEGTKQVMLYSDKNTQCELYPFAHLIWESEKGYARGISEIRSLLDNQREINKIATRRAIAVKQVAFPKIAYDIDKVTNPAELLKTGGMIGVENLRSDDINKVISYLRPGIISQDAAALQESLMNETRELEGASEVATGQIDPTQASGRAIVAVQQAQQAPLNEQVENFKYFLEDCGRIIFELIKVYFSGDLKFYQTKEEYNDLGQTETFEEPFEIKKGDLDKLDLNLKIDITSKGAFDLYYVMETLWNFLSSGVITFEEYVEAIPADGDMQKPILQNILRKRAENRNKIAEMQMQMDQYDSAIQQQLSLDAPDMGGEVQNDVSSMQNSGNANA